jgi:transposase
MAGRQKNYTEEFRREAVRLMETSGKSIAQLARDPGGNDSVLYRWRDVYSHTERLGSSPTGRNVADLEAEVKRLQRENSVLRQERDVLKKAISICSQERT